MLNYLNGINDNNMNGILDRFTTWKNNAIQRLPTPVRNIVNRAGNAAQVGVQIAQTPMRAAFLTLISLNSYNLAGKMETAIRKDKTKSKNFWLNFRGSYADLVRAVNTGIKAGQVGKPTPLALNGNLGAIGLEAGIILATPIIIALIGLLKNLRENTNDLDGIVANGTDLARDGASSGTLPEGATPVVTIPSTLKSNTPLIIGGVAVLGLGAYFLMKKKS
jgi:LPXTG-motif cell wall-anchored protein